MRVLTRRAEARAESDVDETLLEYNVLLSLPVVNRPYEWLLHCCWKLDFKKWSWYIMIRSRSGPMTKHWSQLTVAMARTRAMGAPVPVDSTLVQ